MSIFLINKNISHMFKGLFGILSFLGQCFKKKTFKDLIKLLANFLRISPRFHEIKDLALIYVQHNMLHLC